MSPPEESVPFDGGYSILDAEYRPKITREAANRMTKDEAIELLESHGHVITSNDRMGSGLGFQLKLRGGQIACVYDSGKVVVQGRNREEVAELFGVSSSSQSVPAAPKTAIATPRNVFVVYGHDDKARTELEAMLRRWGLEPLILDQITSGGQTIIKKLEKARGQANFAVVLATPDDEGHKAGVSSEKACRARQNVVLELGTMLAKLGRQKVAILLKSSVTMERPSDIQGLLYISYKDDVKEAALTLAKEINAQGIKIDLDRV